MKKGWPDVLNWYLEYEEPNLENPFEFIFEDFCMRVFRHYQRLLGTRRLEGSKLPWPDMQAYLSAVETPDIQEQNFWITMIEEVDDINLDWSNKMRRQNQNINQAPPNPTIQSPIDTALQIKT